MRNTVQMRQAQNRLKMLERKKRRKNSRRKASMMKKMRKIISKMKDRRENHRKMRMDLQLLEEEEMPRMIGSSGHSEEEDKVEEDKEVDSEESKLTVRQARLITVEAEADIEEIVAEEAIMAVNTKHPSQKDTSTSPRCTSTSPGKADITSSSARRESLKKLLSELASIY